MSQPVSDDFVPDRKRVADADAVVPVIDIAPFAIGDARAREHVVRDVRVACERVGFFVITGHGVDEATIKSVFTQGRAFFARPVADKMRIKRPGPGISRGYNGSQDRASGLQWVKRRHRT